MTETARIELDVASALSLGARSRQEDALVTAFSQGTEIGFAVLSDGMGGHAAGDLASRIIVTEIFAELTLQISRPHFSTADIPALLYHCVVVANECLRNNIDADPSTLGMGGTVIAVVVVGGMLHWISVGDSPLLLFREGRLTRLNEDHSMAPQIDLMVDEGLMDAQTARNHPQRNCLTSALTGDEIAAIDRPANPLALRHDDLVLVASDGLEFLRGEGIEEILAKAAKKDSRHIANALLSGITAMADPEQDNTSLVVIRALSTQAEWHARPAEASPVTMLRAAARVLAPVRHMMTRG